MSITKTNPIEKYINYYKNKTDAERKKRLKEVDDSLTYQNSLIDSEYDSSLGSLAKQKADLEREVIINSIKNKRTINENLSNLGLKNSGLSLSENAANELALGASLADIKSDYSLAVAEQNAGRLKAKADAEMSAAKQQNDLNDYFDKLILSNAQSDRRTDISAAKTKSTQTQDPDKEFITTLTQGIKSAKTHGSAYLYQYLSSLNFDDKQKELVKTALINAGVPSDFYSRFQTKYKNFVMENK